VIQIKGLSSSSPRRQSLAAAAYFGAVACLLGGSLWLIDDLKTSRDRAQEISSRLEQLARRSPRLASRTPDEAANLLFLGGRTTTIAGATLEQRIKDAVEKSGGALTSSEVVSDSPDAKDAKDGLVRLTASIEVDQSGIQTILYDIESWTPYLFVDKLSIQSPEDFGDPETGHFRMTLTVVGQWRFSE
jgi:general secretion pathway protein M